MLIDIPITVPDAQVPRLVAAICAIYGYQATINGSPNPQTANQFALAQAPVIVKQMLIDQVKAYENSQITQTVQTINIT